MIAVDISAFGDPRRDDDVQIFVRRSLYTILKEIFDSSGIAWDACHREDRGDGVLIVMPPWIPVTALIERQVDHLRARLWLHNKMASDAAKIRLRMALHAGPVHFDDYGMAGRDVILLFRLLDAPALRHAGSGAAADLGLVISDRMYHNMIQRTARSGGSIPCQEIMVTVKETHTRAWIYLPSGASARPFPPSCAPLATAENVPARDQRDQPGHRFRFRRLISTQPHGRDDQDARHREVTG
jgi:hypothetical protein